MRGAVRVVWEVRVVRVRVVRVRVRVIWDRWWRHDAVPGRRGVAGVHEVLGPSRLYSWL